MIRSFVLAFVLFVATSAFAADKVACYGEKGQPFYDPDFCQAIKNGHEAMAKMRELLDKSEVMRQTIDRQLKEQTNNRPVSKPGG